MKEYYSGDIEKTVRIDDITGIKIVLENTPNRSRKKAAAIQTADPFTRPLERSLPDSSDTLQPIADHSH